MLARFYSGYIVVLDLLDSKIFSMQCHFKKPLTIGSCHGGSSEDVCTPLLVSYLMVHIEQEKYLSYNYVLSMVLWNVRTSLRKMAMYVTAFRDKI